MKSYKDVMIAFYVHGIDGIGKLRASRMTMRRARKESTDPKFKAAIDDLLGAPRRGRDKPHAGARRQYRVQEVAGQRFLRVPVEVMGLDRGDSVDVKFAGDKITISKI